jgi:hypothetical protein
VNLSIRENRATTPTPGSVMAPRWFVPALQMLPLSERLCLVRNLLDDAAIELSSGEYAVLAACDGCRSLDEHGARAAVRLGAPPGHRPAIRALLERCAHRGLLSAESDLVARFGAACERVVPPLAGIVVRSADRPMLLLRLLNGAAELQTRTGDAYRWYVVDDSRQEESRRANRAAIANNSLLDATHLDLSAAESLEAELTAVFPQFAAETRWLLGAARGDEVTYGRAQNYLLLRFAGKRLLMIDDDVVVQARRPPLSRPGAEVSIGPEAATWYENVDAAFDACPAIDLDPFAEHERWLGRSLAEAWPRAACEPGGLAIGDLPAELYPSFRPGARIIFTRNHVLGDPGWSTFAGRLLDLQTETRRWLTGHPDAARYALESQIRWHGPLSLRLAPHRTLSTTTVTGIDNTCLMPPTVRAGRGGDALLGAAARCARPEGWTVVLPFALPHLREVRRQWLTPTDPYVMPAAGLLGSHMRLAERFIDAERVEQRMEMLGAILRDLAAADDATLRRRQMDLSAEYAAEILFAIQEQLDDTSLPAGWKDVLRQWIVSPMLKLDPTSLSVRIAPPQDVRSVAGEYGRALRVWPQLWSYCRDRFR